MPRKVLGVLKSWEAARVIAKDRNGWRIVPISVWWTISKERNSRCFKSTENNF